MSAGRWQRGGNAARFALLLSLSGAAIGAAAQAGDALGDLPLFWTAAQRQQLDALRARQGTAATAPAAGAKKIVPPASPTVVKIQGLVRRGDGQNTVWINHRAIPENALSERQRLAAQLARGRYIGAAKASPDKPPTVGRERAQKPTGAAE